MDASCVADGRIAAVQNNAGRLVEYAYNTDGSLATVTDPLDRMTTYSYAQGRFGPLLVEITDHWDRNSSPDPVLTGRS